MEYTINRYFKDNNFMDIEIASTVGFDEDDIEDIKKIDGIKDVTPAYSTEAINNVGSASYVMKVLSYTKTVNTPIVKEGWLLHQTGECLVDEDYIKTTGLKLGDTISLTKDNGKSIKDCLMDSEYEIVGIVNMPQYLSIARGQASIGDGSIDNFMVVKKEEFIEVNP